MIYQATYSGVNVYEYICRGIPVMRRKKDGYLNATQLLKVAEFDKPHRTRILEREVQVGVHEKVQGGYGKYQGTWVPFERGVSLAKQYNIYDLISVLLEYVPDKNNSPPLAPKHTQHNTVSVSQGVGGVSGKLTRPTRKPSLSVPKKKKSLSNIPLVKKPNDLSPSPKSEGFLHHVDSEVDSDLDEESEDSLQSLPTTISPETWDAGTPTTASPTEYTKVLLDTFVNEPPSFIPPLLRNPPPNFDVNITIDEEAHTAVHWAAALARIKILKMLLHLGADSCSKNSLGQTALIRAVLFTNNYDNKTFPILLQLLGRSVGMQDAKKKTVIHYICMTASHKGKIQASRYYMETLLEWLGSHQNETVEVEAAHKKKALAMSDLINVQDEDGNTPLVLIAKTGNRTILKQLSVHGALWDIVNAAGEIASDFMTLEEKDQNSFPPNVRASIRRAKQRKMEALVQMHPTIHPKIVSPERKQQNDGRSTPTQQSPVEGPLQERAHSVGVPISFLPQRTNGEHQKLTPDFSLLATPNIHTPQPALLPPAQLLLAPKPVHHSPASQKSLRLMSDISSLLRDLESSSKEQLDDTEQELELLTSQLDHVQHVYRNKLAEFQVLKQELREQCLKSHQDYHLELTLDPRQEQVANDANSDISVELQLSQVVLEHLDFRVNKLRTQVRSALVRNLALALSQPKDLRKSSGTPSPLPGDREDALKEIQGLQQRLSEARTKYELIIGHYIAAREASRGTAHVNAFVKLHASNDAASTSQPIHPSSESNAAESETEAKWLKLLAICSGCSVDEILNILPEIVEMVNDTDT
jgi:ankyrin repeat protein